MFLVQPDAALTLKNIKVTGGTANVMGTGGNGGGIMNEGTLTLEGGSQVYGNAAVFGAAGTGYGGGIWNSGSLVVKDGSIIGGTVALARLSSEAPLAVAAQRHLHCSIVALSQMLTGPQSPIAGRAGAGGPSPPTARARRLRPSACGGCRRR